MAQPHAKQFTPFKLNDHQYSGGNTDGTPTLQTLNNPPPISTPEASQVITMNVTLPLGDTPTLNATISAPVEALDHWQSHKKATALHIPVLLDSGATHTCLSQATYERIPEDLSLIHI